MWELIGGILVFLWYAVCWLAKVAWKFLFYTAPVWFCFIGFFLGGAWSDSAFGAMRQNYIEDTQQKYTHSVTIVWDDETFENIKVREDLNWTLQGSVRGEYKDDDLYYAGNYSESPLTSNTEKPGYVFKGLFDTEFGGEQYVSAGGYSLKRITQNMTLYAIFEPKGA